MMDKNKKKILFVKLGNFSFTNNSVYDQLVDKFADYEIETLDVIELFRQNRIEFALNIPYVFREYGRFGRGWANFSSTAYASRKIQEWVTQHIKNGDYLFTFQTQSLYDASTSACPHYVYTDHTALTNLYYPGFDVMKLRPKTFLRRERVIYENAKLIFTFSNHVSRSVVELYHCDPDKVRRVNSGVNIEVPPISQADKDYTRKNILFVGVDWVRKGGPELVEAFKLAYEQHPDATLTIVGSSPDISHPGINVVGRVPLDQVPGYYRKASIFCMPTKREPFGIVYLEAMHNYLPVVATDIGALPDLIHEGENGFTFRTGDIQGLARGLITLLDDPEKCRAFGLYGHNLAKEEYTWDAVGKKIHTHIMDTLDA